jgi:hypothetical protein
MVFMTTNKRVRCTCARCGKVKYFPAAGMDRSEAFLCEPCDDKYILWGESKIRAMGPGGADRADVTLARFLKEKPYTSTMK